MRGFYIHMNNHFEANGKVRKRIEEIFGWIKAVGTRCRGTEKLAWCFL
jgi:hypothetical protein